MKKPFIKKYILLNYRLFGIIIFAVILSRLDMTMLIEVMRVINKQLLILSILLCILMLVIKSIRWLYLLKQQNISPSLLKTSQVYFIGNFLGTITPGRIGELGKAFYIKPKADNISYFGCFISILTDRLFDILTISVVVLVGMMFIFREYLLIIWAGIICIFLCFTMFYRHRLFIVDLSINYIKWITAKFFKTPFNVEKETIVANLRNIKNTNILIVFFYNTLSLILFYNLIYIIALSCSINIDFFYLGMATSSAMLLSMLPITVAGVGIRDLVLVYFFYKVGIPNEKTVIYSFLYFFLLLFIPSFIGSFMYIFEYIQVFQKPK